MTQNPSAAALTRALASAPVQAALSAVVTAEQARPVVKAATLSQRSLQGNSHPQSAALHRHGVVRDAAASGAAVGSPLWRDGVRKAAMARIGDSVTAADQAAADADLAQAMGAAHAYAASVGRLPGALAGVAAAVGAPRPGAASSGTMFGRAVRKAIEDEPDPVRKACIGQEATLAGLRSVYSGGAVVARLASAQTVAKGLTQKTIDAERDPRRRAILGNQATRASLRRIYGVSQR